MSFVATGSVWSIHEVVWMGYTLGMELFIELDFTKHITDGGVAALIII